MVTIGSELSPGTFVDRRYRIRCVLGRGGFGRTYLAADERRFGELCVLKEFVPKNQGDSVVAQKLYELFHREAKILHKLDHPQIPKFFAVFEENNRLFIVQEYIDGKTYWKLLQERQRQQIAFSEAEVVCWLQDLLPVLDYLHRQNIVHRDISPDNIMLPKQGRLPVLIDFGVVKQAAPHWYEVSSIRPDGSIEASVSVGKLGYAPYEQIRIGQCSPRSDLYALGVTAVVLLTGKPPNLLIDSKSLEWKWHTLVKLNPQLVKILQTMMAEKPNDRYPSAQAVLQDLEQLEFPRPDLQFVSPVTLQYDEATLGTGAFAATDLFSHPTEEVTNSSKMSSTLLELRSTTLEAPLTQVTGLNCIRRPAEVLAQITTESGYKESSHRAQITQSAQPKQRFRATTPKLSALLSKVFKQPNPLTAQPPTTRLTILVGQNQPASRWFTRKALIFSSLLLLPIGGVAIGIRSPHIAALCQTLNNCADGRHLALRYQEANRQAQEATQLSVNAQSVTDLKLAQDRLSDSIAKLISLPASSEWFTEAQRILSDYRTKLNQLEARLEKETRATELLDRAIAEAQQADRQTKMAKTPQELENAQSQWRKALATLSAVPNSSFIANQVAERSQQYSNRLKEIDIQIAGNLPATVAQSPLASPSSNSSPQPSVVPSDAAPANTPAASSTSPPRSTVMPAPTRATSPSPRVIAKPQPAPVPSPTVRPSRSAPAPQTPTVAAAPAIPSISLAPAASALRSNSPAAVPRQLPDRQAAVSPSGSSNRRTAPGNVSLSAAQTVNDVSIRLSGARVISGGTYAANLIVENQSNRAFGFVPLFAEVRDSSGQPVQSRVLFHGSEDAMVNPGEHIQGEIYLLDRYWNEAGSQNLTLVIREGTSGNRNFHVQF